MEEQYYSIHMGMKESEREWEKKKPPNQTNEIESNKIERLQKKNTHTLTQWEWGEKMWKDERKSVREDGQHTKM